MERKDGDELFLKRLGERIQSLRKEQGISQVGFSHTLEIEASNLRRIESGKTNPTSIMLKRIADALKVDIADLFC